MKKRGLYIVGVILCVLVPQQLFAASTATTTHTERVLSYGMSGEDVRQLQSELAQLPSFLSEQKVSGYFGPQTRKSVQQIQKSEKIITATNTNQFGKVDARTRTRIHLLVLGSSCWKGEKVDAACALAYYHDFATRYGVSSALALVNANLVYNPKFQSSCHPITHEIGHIGADEFKTLGDAFMKGSTVCQSGYYHGVVEDLLKDKDITSLSKADLLLYCANMATTTTIYSPKFSCIHGMGHALMYMSHDDIGVAMMRCTDYAVDAERSQCVNGVLMQRWITKVVPPGVSPVDAASRDCSQVAGNQDICWLAVGAYTLTHDANNPDGAKQFCATLKTDDYRNACNIRIADITSASSSPI